MAWDGCGGVEPDILRQQWKDIGADSGVGPGYTVGDGGNVSQNGTGRNLEKAKAMVCTPGFV